MPNKDVGSRLSEQTTKHVPSDKSYQQANKERFDKIKREPMVGVYGNPLYVPYLGDAFSFDYQDFSVTIPFDGKTHYYHETIAKILQAKLDATARVNVPKVAGDGEKLR